MSDKLVTLAIRTYQRAQMIKTVLEEHGIETIIHNLNLEHPEMAVGVRVRIKEKDLPQALAIVEQIEKEWEKENGEEKREKPPILIPIDFSDQVAKSIDFGFEFARKHGTAVKFLYVYYTPMFTISSNNEVSTYSISDGELLRRIVTAANADVENMTNLINKRIDRGELPKVPFSFDLKEGVPEDQILDYCKRFEPALVIMGTRGKKITQTNALIGSVTAEVIDSCLRPVLALPMEMPFDNPDDIHRVAFLTNFDQKDLIAIDSTIKLLDNEELEIHFIHATEKNEVWNEVVLGGIKTYFAEHYPKLTAKYEIIGGAQPDIPLLDDYLARQHIDMLAFNARRRNLFARLFNPGLAYKMVLHSNTPLFVTHI